MKGMEDPFCIYILTLYICSLRIKEYYNKQGIIEPLFYPIDEQGKPCPNCVFQVAMNKVLR
jgi:hypothetical protein